MSRVIVREPRHLQRALELVGQVKPDGDAPLEVVIQPYEPDQTAEQRAYWHVLLGLLSKEIGEPAGRIKMTIKARVYGTYFREDMDGRLYLELPSSRKFRREMYSRLIDYTLQYAAEEHGVVLPSPRVAA